MKYDEAKVRKSLDEINEHWHEVGRQMFAFATQRYTGNRRDKDPRGVPNTGSPLGIFQAIFPRHHHVTLRTVWRIWRAFGPWIDGKHRGQPNQPNGTVNSDKYRLLQLQSARPDILLAAVPYVTKQTVDALLTLCHVRTPAQIVAWGEKALHLEGIPKEIRR